MAEVLETIAPTIGAAVAAYVAARAVEWLGHEPSDEEVEAMAAEAAAELDLSGFDEIVPEAQDALADVGSAAVDHIEEEGGRLKLSVDAPMFNQVNEDALAYARERAAEMVGRRWEGDVLVDNPRAGMAITETTRDAIRKLVVRALSPSTEEPFNLHDALSDLTDEVTGSPLFSRSRAALIAQAEVGMAQSRGTFASLKALERSSGLRMKKRWSTSHDEKVCLELCALNAEEGAIPLDQVFQSGDLAPLAHPRCRCAIVGVITKEPTNS